MFKDLPGFPSSERLQPLARNFNLRLIVLFGSAARGATNQESDLDLGVLAEQPLPAAPRLNLWRALSSLFRADVDLTMLNQASPLVNYQVASEGIVLLEMVPHAWETWKSYAVRHYWDTSKFREGLKTYLASRAEEMRHAAAE